VHLASTLLDARETGEGERRPDNHVMLLQDAYGDFDTTSPVLIEALLQMDQWLTNLSKNAGDEAIVKLRRAKPADLVDACWTKDETPQKIVEKQQYRAGRCNEIYPAFSYPRGVAGAPISNDIAGASSRPSARPHKTAFTADEMELGEDLPGRRL
jgi:hypothetical protein